MQPSRTNILGFFIDKGSNLSERLYAALDKFNRDAISL